MSSWLGATPVCCCQVLGFANSLAPWPKLLVSALPVGSVTKVPTGVLQSTPATASSGVLPSRSEEHTSELQSRQYLVCRLLLEKKNNLLLLCILTYYIP